MKKWIIVSVIALIIIIVVVLSLNKKDEGPDFEALSIELNEMAKNIFAPPDLESFYAEKNKWASDPRMLVLTFEGLFGPTRGGPIKLSEYDLGRRMQLHFSTIGYAVNQSDGVNRILIAFTVYNEVDKGNVRVDLEFFIDDKGNILGVDRRQT